MVGTCAHLCEKLWKMVIKKRKFCDDREENAPPGSMEWGNIYGKPAHDCSSVING